MGLLFATYDLASNFTMLNKNVEAKCLTLKDFIISQALIDNEPGIQTQLNQENQSNTPASTLHLLRMK